MESDASTISADQLRQLADIACVPDETRQSFGEAMQRVVDQAWRLGKDWKAPQFMSAETVEGLSRVHQAARELQCALDDLDARAEGWIEASDVQNLDSAGEGRRLLHHREVVSSLLAASRQAEATARSLLPSRGAPSREPGDPGFSSFDLLVYGTLNAINRAGGKVTHNKNTEVAAGTLSECLRCLASVLPAGLVPHALPHSRLQRAKSKWTKNRSSIR